MFFTGESRKAFLEFLRNLTPQILFLTLALIWGVKIDFHTWDITINGFLRYLPFAACVFVFFEAALLNIGQFIESATTSNEILDKHVEEIKNMETRQWMRIYHIVLNELRYNKKRILKLLVTSAVCEISLVAVFILAIQGAYASPFVRIIHD